MTGDVKRIKIYHRYDGRKEWIADCLVRLNGYPEIHDSVPDLREEVRKVIEENLLCVKGQIWLTGEISVFEETYGWVSEDMPEERKEDT
jgi:hypothetical protein